MDNIFTGLRKVEQMLHWLTTIAEQTSEGIMVADLNGITRFANAAVAKMHGYPSSKDLIGKKISAFHSADQMNTDVLPMIEEVKRKGQLMGPVGHLRNDGVAFGTQTKMILLKNWEDKVVGLLIVVADITKQVETEKAFTKRVYELGNVNKQLEIQIDRHKQSEKSLSEKTSELTTCNENLQHQVSEQKQAVSQLTQQLEGLTAELDTAKEQLQRQVSEQEISEESFKQHNSELTACNETLQQQVAEYQQKVNEQLEKQALEYQKLEEIIGESANDMNESILPTRALDKEKLQSLAEMVKLLS